MPMASFPVNEQSVMVPVVVKPLAVVRWMAPPEALPPLPSLPALPPTARLSANVLRDAVRTVSKKLVIAPPSPSPPLPPAPPSPPRASLAVNVLSVIATVAPSD
jgi:hypothetical protein